MKQYIFRDGNSFSRHTTIEDFAEMIFDRLLADAFDEEEEESIREQYGESSEEKDRELIEEIYSYEIHEPTEELIADWERYHDTKWSEE